MSSSIRKAFEKAFQPTVAITAQVLDKGTTHKTILAKVAKVLSYEYETMFDKETGIIYIGKRA